MRRHDFRQVMLAREHCRAHALPLGSRAKKPFTVPWQRKLTPCSRDNTGPLGPHGRYKRNSLNSSFSLSPIRLASAST
jgi:hypothetical protein